MVELDARGDGGDEDAAALVVDGGAQLSHGVVDGVEEEAAERVVVGRGDGIVMSCRSEGGGRREIEEKEEQAARARSSKR